MFVRLKESMREIEGTMGGETDRARVCWFRPPGV